MNEDNIIFCIVGPSGCGKSTRVKNFMNNHQDICNLLVSDTTRQKRNGEIDGKDYHFLSKEEFKKRNHVESVFYNGHCYGLSEEEVNKKCGEKPITFFICDVEGYNILNALRGYNNIVGIYLQYPSSQCIRNMTNRGDDPNKIKDRVFYDCSIDAYTLDKKAYFNEILSYQPSWKKADSDFEEAVLKYVNI